MVEELNINKKEYMRKIVCILLIVAGFSSCASLPKEAVEMTLLLDKQLDALQQSHLDMVELYCSEREKRAISFLDNEWYPSYLNNLFENESVQDLWQQVINSEDKQERMSMLKLLTQVSQEDYNAQKVILREPITESRAELRKVILFEYQKAKEMNLTVTNNIASVHDVQEIRKNYLSKAVDVDNIEYRLEQSIHKIDSVFNKTQNLIDSYNKNEDKINKIIDKLK